MKPLLHAESSARKWGGVAGDYLAIHDEMDCTKAALADVRHRAVYHSSFGIFVIEKIFGTCITNSAGKNVSVRDIAEQHVIEDLGKIPTLQDWLTELPVRDWMGKPQKKVTEMSLFDYKTMLGDSGRID